MKNENQSGHTAKQIKHSDALNGEMVTTYGSKFGGVGVGYLVGDTVYKTTGSYWAIDARDDMDPMDRYDRDGGKGYRNTLGRVQSTCIEHAYGSTFRLSHQIKVF